MTPSVGRVVHYRSYGTPAGEYEPRCRAAVVTTVDDYSEDEGQDFLVGLAVLNPEGMFFNQYVPQDPTASRGGTWHWPERV